MGSNAQSQQSPGTLSPITGILLDLFGGTTGVKGGQFVPTTWGQGGAFNSGSFGALPGLLENMPLTGAESTVLGGDWQNAALGAGVQSQQALNLGAAALPDLLATNPAASIAAARRGFTEETLPAILERAPGFSSSDLQRELVRGGTDLETNIAALKEANLGRVGQVVQGLPAFASAMGSNLVDQGTQILGFGQLGRDFAREQTPAGDAFRVLTAIQSLVGPGLTTSGSSKSTGVL